MNTESDFKEDSHSDIACKHLAILLHKRCHNQESRTAWLVPDRGQWRHVTWFEVGHEVFKRALVLQKLGVHRGQRVAVLCKTRWEASLLDFAILSLGAVLVPIYPSVGAEECSVILTQSQCGLVILEDALQRQKILAIQSSLNQKTQFLSMDTSDHTHIQSLSLFLGELSQEMLDSTQAYKEWELLSESFSSSDLAMIMYTSGTTGKPKGARIRHDNLFFCLDAVIEKTGLGPDDLSLMFLPTSHVMGRLEQLMGLMCGMRTAYSQGFKSIAEEILDIKPTILLGVPRLFEVAFGEVARKLDSGHLPQKLATRWVMSVTQEYSERLQAGVNIPALLQAQVSLLKNLVFDPVYKRFGGQLRYAICGGAPLQSDLVRFFQACGVMILEGYGLTETTGPCTMNSVGAYRLGSVGQVLPGLQIRTASDGELLVRGPGVFEGYEDPDDNIDIFEEGWFKTGDVGRVDEQGFVYIVDRKKDVIITSGGKNIAPQKVETALGLEPLIQYALIVGDRYKHVAALVVLNVGRSKKLIEKLGTGRNMSYEQAVESEPFQKVLRQRIAQVNTRLNPYERIRKFKILTQGFSVDGGELTPSLKVRRSYCVKKYKTLIEEMYAQEEELADDP